MSAIALSPGGAIVYQQFVKKNHMKKKILYFVLIPVGFNFLFFGLYFSGIDILQQFIVPRISSLYESSWREFGMVEQLQNLFLIFIMVLFLSAILKRELKSEKIFFCLGLVVILFVFLEEIDYGLHFAHYFFNSSLEIHRLNLHNQHTFSGNENVQYIKKLNDLICIFWFLIVPFLKNRFRFQPVRSIIPSPWFIATIIVSFICSSLAHYLNDQGFGIINNHQGGLNNNISEFRETTIYYLYLLYALQLVKEINLKNE